MKESVVSATRRSLFGDPELLRALAVSVIGLVAEVLEGFKGNYSGSKAVALIVFALGVVVSTDILKSGIKALKNLQFSKISLLVTLAAVGACILGEYLEAAVVLSLFSLGERLEALGVESSQSALKGLLARSPKQAEVKGKGVTAVSELKVGEVVLLRTGQILPIDGKVVSGNGVVDESSLTGESMPKAKLEGDVLLSGSMLVTGYLEIAVEKEAKDSTLTKIIELTFQASAQKAQFQKFIERFSKIYTPTAIFGALLIFLIPTLFLGGDWHKWLEQALTLLVIACPCALVISTPVSIFSAMGNAASRGVLVKGGRSLEALSKVTTIALDKTRTLTEGRPTVVEVLTFSELSENEVLACTAGLEKFSEHPLAMGILNEAKKRGVRDHDSASFESIPGKGAKAQCFVCQGKERFVGSKTFAFEKLKVSQEVQNKIENFEGQGKTCVLLWDNERVEGLITLQDVEKSEAKQSLLEIKSLGLKIVVLSGDSMAAVEGVTKNLQVDLVKGGLLPQDKAAAIQQMQSEGQKVAMVGDGVNDAPALAVSEVGIAMGAAGSDAAIEVANIALLNDKLDRIPFLIKLARRTWNVIRFNTWFAVATKLVVLALAAAGKSSLSFAIISDVGVTAFVVFLSLALLASKEQKEGASPTALTPTPVAAGQHSGGCCD